MHKLGFRIIKVCITSALQHLIELCRNKLSCTEASTIPDLTPEPHGNEKGCIYCQGNTWDFSYTCTPWEEPSSVFCISIRHQTKCGIHKLCTLFLLLLSETRAKQTGRKKRQSCWMHWTLVMENNSEVVVDANASSWFVSSQTAEE